MPDLARRPERNVGPDKVRHLDDELPDPAHEDAHRERHDGRVDVADQGEHADDHPDVHDRRAQRGHEEPPVGVEGAHHERGEPDQDQIREHQPCQHHRERELPRLAGEAGRHQADDPRCEQTAERGHGAQHQDRGPEERSEQALEIGTRTRDQVVAQHRHHRGREGPLAQEAAEDVGDPEGDEERVGHRPGAERAGHDHVAHEAEHPTGERRDADAPERADDLGLVVRSCNHRRFSAL